MKMTTLLRLIGTLATCFMILLTIPLACSSNRGFRCGEPIASDGEIVQSCEGPNEICVCATRSCAAVNLDFVAGGMGGQGDGEGGDEDHEMDECRYRYLDSPFADEEWAGKCVPESHLAHDIIEKSEPSGTLCEDVRPPRLTRYEEPYPGGSSSTNEEEPMEGPTDPPLAGGAGGEAGAL